MGVGWSFSVLANVAGVVVFLVSCTRGIRGEKRRRTENWGVAAGREPARRIECGPTGGRAAINGVPTKSPGIVRCGAAAAEPGPGDFEHRGKGGPGGYLPGMRSARLRKGIGLAAGLCRIARFPFDEALRATPPMCPACIPERSVGHKPGRKAALVKRSGRPRAGVAAAAPRRGRDAAKRRRVPCRGTGRGFRRLRPRRATAQRLRCALCVCCVLLFESPHQRGRGLQAREIKPSLVRRI